MTDPAHDGTAGQDPHPGSGPAAAGAPAQAFDQVELERIRADFRILRRQVSGHGLSYLDSGATSQRPETVLDAEQEFLTTAYGAVHRGAHALAEASTDAYEDARAAVAQFVGREPDEIVWTLNATHALNLVALGLSDPLAARDPAFARYALRAGDEIVVTEMEHHANLVPWQQAAARSGATLRWIPLDDDGRLDLTDLGTIVNGRTRVVAFTHVSNVLGTVNPVDVIVARAREVGALTVLDACQSVPHMAVDLASLGVDLAAFSAHKMLGPSGLGVLAGRREVLEALPPVLTGGSMVERVSMESTTFREPPTRFEAGTQPVSQAVAMHAAVDYLTALGMDRVEAHEHSLTERLLDALTGVTGVRVLGPRTARQRAGAVSVLVDGVHPHDVGQFLDAQGIAVRVGHHCAQPVHRRYGANASTRASLYVYSTPTEVDLFVEALSKVRPYFGRE